ncbi:MAG: hypothetical protein HRT61_19580 [Ekhidna sp.]|nr:hypothetical protein [Ekhidna sp.]
MSDNIVIYAKMSKYNVEIWSGNYGESMLLNLPDVKTRKDGLPDMRCSASEKIMKFFEFVDKTQRDSYLKNGVVPAYFNYTNWCNER